MFPACHVKAKVGCHCPITWCAARWQNYRLDIQTSQRQHLCDRPRCSSSLSAVLNPGSGRRTPLKPGFCQPAIEAYQLPGNRKRRVSFDRPSCPLAEGHYYCSSLLSFPLRHIGRIPISMLQEPHTSASIPTSKHRTTTRSVLVLG